MKVPDSVIRDVLVALFAEGHVLIEDYPGVGKTALARALARSIDAEYARIQCTADLLPADVVGTNVYNQRETRFEFRPGPVFANVVLVDEVNRASPKTQSGLLECMQERHVTVDGTRTSWRARSSSSRRRTRWSTRAPTRCPRRSSTASWCASRSATRRRSRRATCSPDHAASDRVLDLEPVADVAEVLAAQIAAAACTASEALRRYVVAVSEPRAPTRAPELGASPRAGLMLFQRREGATPRSTAATTRFPTTCRSSPAPCSPTVCCSRRAPVPTSAPRSSATRWSGFPRSDALMLRPLFTALLGVALCLAGGAFDTPSLYVPGVGLRAVGGRGRLGAAGGEGRPVMRVPGPHTVVEE